jgi:signal transduction histidine kinase
MTIRAKVLLFTAVAVGLVVVMGAMLIAGSIQGRRARDRALATEAQALLLTELRTGDARYPHTLLEALDTRLDTAAVRDEALRRTRGDFARLRELAEHKARQGVRTDAETEALARAEAAYLRWLEETEALVRQVTPGTEARFFRQARQAFTRNVESVLLRASEFEAAEKAFLIRDSSQAFQVGQALGTVLPLVSLLLVGGLALTLLVPLRRSLRELVAGAERVGKGDFEQLLPEARGDELGMAARAFNHMARELRDTVAQKQRLARAEAEASEQRMRGHNAVLETTVRERTEELEAANARLTDSLRQLQATQAQLLFADRLASVGQLATGVAHEINNPLAFIISNLEFVREELCDAGMRDEQQREEMAAALSEAGEGAERVRVIVRELQNLSRPDSMESGPVELPAVVRSALKMSMHLIRPRAQLVLEVDGAPPVYGNGARLCQVVLNLLLNAAHAIEPGQVGRHTIRVSARVEDPGTVTVEVSDTGCGIAPEDLGRIFDPFFTTRPVGMGTGLGLAVCHGIVASHGGDITVASELGRGSTFRVRLPSSGRQPPYLDGLAEPVVPQGLAPRERLVPVSYGVAPARDSEPEPSPGPLRQAP